MPELLKNADAIMVEVICGDLTLVKADLDAFDIVEAKDGTIVLEGWNQAIQLEYWDDLFWVDYGNSTECIWETYINAGCKLRISFDR